MKPSIYVAGTGQHSGKTLVSLGLVAALRQRGLKVSYMKPVGQRTVSFGGAVVDEDVALVNQVFALPCPPELANPVTIPSGYTRRFLTEGRSPDELLKKIRAAFDSVCHDADLVVVEGTGHAGVGAVIGLSNARVARLLDSAVIVVTGGGIGRALDEFEVNRALFEEQTAPVLGMISNKVLRGRLSEITAAQIAWLSPRGYELWGAIPYEASLTEITLAQIVSETEARVLSGEQQLERKIRKFIIGAAPCHRLLQFFAKGVLMITPGDRDDLILAAISWERAAEADGEAGLAVCLTSDVPPDENVLRLARSSQVPVIAVSAGTYEVTARLSDLIAKMAASDSEKVNVAQELVAGYVNVTGLIERLRPDLSLPSE